ncbi:MAG TPA: hypothetical protein VF407_23740 [Polyangiaceae bacterium]
MTRLGNIVWVGIVLVPLGLLLAVAVWLYGTKRVTVLADARPFTGSIECNGRRHDLVNPNSDFTKPEITSFLVWGGRGACAVRIDGPKSFSTTYSYTGATHEMFCTPDWDRSTLECFDDDD